MPTEPKWPTLDEVQTEVGRRVAATGQALLQTSVAIDMCRSAWLAANDDPAADLPGTVRISPDGMTVVTRSGMDDGVPWLNLSKLDPGDVPWWFTSTEVVGWTRGTPVEGTPAAKALLPDDYTGQMVGQR